MPTYCLWAEPGTIPVNWAATCGLLTERDPALGAIIARVGGDGLLSNHPRSTFESLARSIVYQQLSGKAAETIYQRFRALYPAEVPLDPASVFATRHQKLRKAGLSEAKARSIKDLAAHAGRGEIPPVEEIRQMDPEAVVERLTVVRGIGRWTVEMLLLFRVGHPDVLPIHDLGIQKGFARMSRRRELPDPQTIMRRGERWRPFRSVASWYLWRAVELPRGRSTARSR